MRYLREIIDNDFLTLILSYDGLSDLELGHECGTLFGIVYIAKLEGAIDTKEYQFLCEIIGMIENNFI